MSDLGSLQATNLTISRGEMVLLEGADLSLAPSSISYLQGENGAGKTSLMRVLAGLTPACEGKVEWNQRLISHPESSYQQDLLFLAHALSMKSSLSILENLSFYASLRGVSNPQKTIQSALAELGLELIQDRHFAELSAGQQHKVCLCRLLIEPAKIWILDEPFVNLDHKTRLWLAQQIEVFAQKGGIVLFTSHHEIKELKISQRISLQVEQAGGSP